MKKSHKIIIIILSLLLSQCFGYKPYSKTKIKMYHRYQNVFIYKLPFYPKVFMWSYCSDQEIVFVTFNDIGHKKTKLFNEMKFKQICSLIDSVDINCKTLDADSIEYLIKTSDGNKEGHFYIDCQTITIKKHIRDWLFQLGFEEFGQME